MHHPGRRYTSCGDEDEMCLPMSLVADGVIDGHSVTEVHFSTLYFNTSFQSCFTKGYESIATRIFIEVAELPTIG